MHCILDPVINDVHRSNQTGRPTGIFQDPERVGFMYRLIQILMKYSTQVLLRLRKGAITALHTQTNQTYLCLGAIVTFQSYFILN